MNGFREACELALRYCEQGDADTAAYVLRSALVKHEEEEQAAAEIDEMVDHHKQIARGRGWLVGDINQTDSWFTDKRTPEQRFGGAS